MNLNKKKTLLLQQQPLAICTSLNLCTNSTVQVEIPVKEKPEINVKFYRKFARNFFFLIFLTFLFRTSQILQYASFAYML